MLNNVNSNQRGIDYHVMVITGEEIKESLFYTEFVQYTDQDNIDLMKQQFPANCELVLYTDHLQDTDKNQYRCAVITDYVDKKVIFAIEGTRFGFTLESFYDLVDDYNIARNVLPPKLTQAQILNDIILDNIEYDKEDDIRNWHFIFTGHSMGGCLSHIAAADIATKLYARHSSPKGKIISIAFEGPGAKTMVDIVYSNGGLDPSSASDDIEFLNINNKSNFINNLHTHIGPVWQISKTYNNYRYLQDTYLYRVNLFQQIQDHLLRNFIDVIRYGNGVLKDEEGNIISLEVVEQDDQTTGESSCSTSTLFKIISILTLIATYAFWLR